MDSYLRGPNQKVIAYTLFGEVNKRYYSLLKDISSATAKLYPDWIVRIYHNLDNQSWSEGKDQHQLCDVYCQFKLVDVCSWQHLVDLSVNDTLFKSDVSSALLGCLNAKMYRFLAMLDPDIHIFISRDADSLILQREVDAVEEWLHSNYTFHIMRDHINHHETFMAGMFFWQYLNLCSNKHRCYSRVEWSSRWDYFFIWSTFSLHQYLFLFWS